MRIAGYKRKRRSKITREKDYGVEDQGKDGGT
jgi:hypothetical protein